MTEAAKPGAGSNKPPAAKPEADADATLPVADWGRHAAAEREASTKVDAPTLPTPPPRNLADTVPTSPSGAAATVITSRPDPAAATVVTNLSGGEAPTLINAPSAKAPGTARIPLGEAATVVTGLSAEATAKTASRDLSGANTAIIDQTSDPPSGGHAATKAADPTKGTGSFSGANTALSPTRTGAGTGAFTRTGRTRVNLNLPAEAQRLDEKLQLSRTSVLVDMAGARGRDTLPPGLRKLIGAQGTEGRYAVTRALAAGGMGAVLQILDHDFQRGAAMKVIHGRYAHSPEALERFLAEAQVTAQLEHPNIVPIHDLGVMDDGTLYFTMKLIEGQSLGAVIKALKAGEPAAVAHWSDEEKILVFLKVLDGVGFAHSRGVVHRDIKPDNIMLGPHGEVLVVDWGIAKVMAKADQESELVQQVVSIRDEQSLSATIDGAAMGTAYYMPPEQAGGVLALVDERSDIYALGATLYEMLSLKRSIEGANLHELIAKTMSGDTIPLAKVAPHLSLDLIAVVKRAMATDSGDRYQSCAAFADDLRRYLAGQAVLARKRNLIERIGQWYSAHKRQVLVGAGAALLAIAAVAVTILLQGAAARGKAADLRRIGEQALTAGHPIEALDAFTRALGLVDGDQELVRLREQARAAVTLDEKGRNDKRQAVDFLAKGRTQQEGGDLAAAETSFKAGFALDPGNIDLDQALADVRQRRQSKEFDERKRAADSSLAIGKVALDKAKALAPTDPAVDETLDRAREAFTAVEKSGIPLPGTQELAAAVALLRKQAADARTGAEKQRLCREAVAGAKAALAAGKLGAARDLVAQALGHVPGDAEADQLRLQIVEQERLAELQGQKAANIAKARQQADSRLAEARGGVTRMVTAKASADQAANAVERLSGELATKPLEQKAPLWQAHRDARAARTAVAEQWALTEAAAQSALGFLTDDRDYPAYAAAQQILAELYHGRLVEARARRNLPEIAAFTNLLRRYAGNAYQGDLANQGRLTVNGAAPGSLVMRRLEAGSDTRLAPVGDPIAIVAGKPIDLDAGRYQLSAGEVQIAVVVGPGSAVAVDWPGQLPSIPEVPLRYVPGAGGGRGFMLGQSEVTQEQYLKFLTDPAVFAKIKASWKKARMNLLGPDESLALLPRRSPTADEVWQVFNSPKDENDLVDIKLPEKRSKGTPVTSINRDDAEAYCVWLADANKLKVRLPTTAEWQYAANGGDDRRIYPWGEVFDGALAVTALGHHSSGPDAPEPVLSCPTDVGPFGHYDLAGNVREWLGDKPTAANPLAAGVHGARIAGGCYGDESADVFRSSYTESVRPDLVFGSIGFRILVELP